MDQNLLDQKEYLKQITGIYLLLSGGKALHNIDTPAFMRKAHLEQMSRSPHVPKDLPTGTSLPINFKNSRIAA